MMMFCPDCSRNLDDVPVGDPCPQCGSTRRSAAAPAGVAAAAGSAADVTASVRIVASGTVAPERVPAITTNMGVEVDKTFVIYESKPIEGGIRQYELHIDGKVVWTGMGDDRVDALLTAIQSATGEADDLPDN